MKCILQVSKIQQILNELSFPVKVVMACHLFITAFPVSRQEESRKVMVLPRMVLVPVTRPDESR